MTPISFAIQKPRPSAFDDSDSDSEAEQRRKANAVESLSEFDASSSSKRRRAEAGAANGGPALVIPSQPNKDWKKEAQLLRAGSRRKVKTYLPDEALAGQARKGPQLTEAELAAVDKITADAAGGLSQASRSGTATPTTELRGALAHATLASASNSAAASPAATQPEDPETDDARALRELLKGGGPDARDAPEVDVIEQHADNTFKMGSKEEGDESDNFRRDLDSRPDSSTLDDYARVPVEHFGAALLRGMGWGSSATDRAARKPTEAIVPTARPALLGIGAKPLVSNEEPGSKSSSRSGPKKSRREEMKFVPLMKRENSSASTPNEDRALMPPPPRPSSRQRSNSPPSRSSKKCDSDDRRERSEGRRDRDRDESKSSRRRSRSRSPDRRRGTEERDRDKRKYRDEYRSSSSKRDRDDRRRD